KPRPLPRPLPSARVHGSPPRKSFPADPPGPAARLRGPNPNDHPPDEGPTMCGIAGALDLNGSREFPTSRLLAMTGAIAHRGPDDEQVHIDPGVALGARRLSIIDLSGGRQPIANERGDVWVAFNGELFEYPELREELLARGHHLATRCD